MFKVYHALFLVIIRAICRVYWFKAGDPKTAKAFLNGIFRKFPGHHGWISHHIFIAILIPDTWKVKERVRINTVCAHNKKTVMLRNPLSGNEYLIIEHSGLLFSLHDNQFVVDYGGAVQKYEIGDRDNGTNGYDKLSPKGKFGLNPDVYR